MLEILLELWLFSHFRSLLWVGPALLFSTATAVNVLGWDGKVRSILSISMPNAGIWRMSSLNWLSPSYATAQQRFLHNFSFFTYSRKCSCLCYCFSTTVLWMQIIFFSVVLVGALNDRLLLATPTEINPKQKKKIEIKSCLVGLLEPLLIGFATMQQYFGQKLDLPETLYQITSRCSCN